MTEQQDGRAGGSETYKGAGVDIAAGEEAVLRIKEKVRSTFRPEVIGDIGGFGGLFSFANHRYVHPVLVSSTDGVGTKAVVAQAAGRFDTIGVDLVAMCVDDIACAGAEPLFFLDYIAVGHLDPDHIEQLVEGVAEGCRQAGCALIGGEMAEHPGAMDPGEFDLVGFAVGVVERDLMLGPDRVHAGDALIGLPSPGLRSNGYSLARRVLLDRAGLPLDGPAYEGARHSLAEELLEPSVVYAPAIRALLDAVDVHALAHVTGGGLPGNLPRSLPKGCDAIVDEATWEAPRIFGEVQRHGDISPEEMRSVFNMGLGMVAVVPREDLYAALDTLRAAGHRAVEIGAVERGHGQLRYA
ncbi:phosphoribosylformylglycinamidine cyclo-ligase [Iamia majanohamensis]|uniref:Phosphoribosylformylglycinamidine cyclo-ligase n=1 Tax=Iamia majanohamensis TaxID=467976 RepID=A0AAE9YAA8_9ACTN|nr:phosphoribosylformylglycinamidine cyclo-ligase [Iamia majanohamensis]WCO67304.1 phosphoribosylformylglycinamidine cyclo-ligase [Iamia majanohamensis]